MIAATGAAFVGLSAENDLLSPVFWAYLRELPAEVGSRMNMLSDPMYPVSVLLVLIQGGLAFAIVRISEGFIYVDPVADIEPDIDAAIEIASLLLDDS